MFFILGIVKKWMIMCGRLVVFIISVKVIVNMLIMFLVLFVYLVKFRFWCNWFSLFSSVMLELLVMLLMKLSCGMGLFVILMEMKMVGIIKVKISM